MLFRSGLSCYVMYVVNKYIDNLFFTWSVMGQQNNTIKIGVPGFFRLFRCSGVFRGVPGCSGVFRCSGVPGCSGVPVFQCSGVPVFLVLVHAVWMSLVDP